MALLPGNLRIGDGRQPVILVAVVDRLARGLEVRGDLLREVRGRIEHVVGAPGVGADERHAPPEIVVGRTRHVAGVVGDGEDLVERIVGVGGPKADRAAIVQKPHARDVVVDVAVHVARHVVRVGDARPELRRVAPVVAEAVGEAGGFVGGVLDRERPVEHVVGCDGGLDRVEGGVERARLPQGLGGGVI